MAHVCNPSTLGGWGGWITRSRDWDHPGQHGETPSLLKIQKFGWAWWGVPVIPATQEAEAGELPEPRRQRLRWAEIAPSHSSLSNKSETPSQKRKENPKISWGWWHMHVVPATVEAEAGESLEPGRWRLQWAEITLLHYSLGDRVRLLSKQNKTLKKKTKTVLVPVLWL